MYPFLCLVLIILLFLCITSLSKILIVVTCINSSLNVMQNIISKKKKVHWTWVTGYWGGSGQGKPGRPGTRAVSSLFLSTHRLTPILFFILMRAEASLRHIGEVLSHFLWITQSWVLFCFVILVWVQLRSEVGCLL